MIRIGHDARIYCSMLPDDRAAKTGWMCLRILFFFATNKNYATALVLI